MKRKSCGGIINHSWTFLFYDYGDNKESLDRMMPIFIPDDFDTSVSSEGSA